MTKPVFTNKQISNNQVWKVAMQWVYDNKKLVRQIAAPYLRHMAAESNDLLQEATIAAFKALNIARDKNEPKKFVPFFRVVFKTNCIKLASGIQTVHCEFHLLSGTYSDQEEICQGNQQDLNRAFKAMTKRQREVCSWVLNQPLPVSTPDLAREFRVSRRHACRLISNSIDRITVVQK